VRTPPPPRWQTPLPADWAGSWGPDVELFARRVLNIRLDRWQRKAMNRALLYRADGTLCHRVYLISAARQQGKSAMVRALIGWALTARDMPDWQRILGLAHDRAQARIPYEAVMADLGPLAARYGRAERGGLSITRYLGIRSRMHGRYREYHTGSREAADSVRSQTNDLGVFDEVRTQRDWRTWAALEPTTTARPDPLIWAISTAGDDRSVLLRSWWERGLRIIDGAEPMTDFGMTWYAAPENAAPDSRHAIVAANPAVAEGRIPLRAIMTAVGTSGGADTAMFRNERLNLWVDAVDEWLPPGVWVQRIGPQPERDGRVILAVETATSWRRASVVVAVPSDVGAWVGIAAERRAEDMMPAAPSLSPADLIAAVGEAAATWKPAGIAYVRTAAAAEHIERWCEDNDVPSIPLGPGDMRKASELFRAELIGGRLTHPDDPLLAQQVRTVRPSGPMDSGSWYLSVKESRGDVDAVRAAAWAAWAAIAPPEADTPLQIFV
jgi:phage terminase large subunit-like protein